MTRPPMNGNGGPPGPPLPGGKVPVDPAAVTQELLRACLRAAEQSSSAQDTREMSEAAKAALSFAQAIVVLDPTRAGDGVPLAHELGMEAVKQDGMERLESARQAAAAPSPVRSTEASG